MTESCTRSRKPALLVQDTLLDPEPADKPALRKSRPPPSETVAAPVDAARNIALDTIVWIDSGELTHFANSAATHASMKNCGIR
jgi:hypothetical protein